MQLTQISFYPIKSCQGMTVDSAFVTAKGIKDDRTLMIIDGQGKFITQRQYPQLALISVTLSGEEITLRSQTGNPKPLTFTKVTQGETTAVQIWRDRTLAIDQGNAIAQWLQTFLETSENIRLVYQSPEHIRQVNPQYTTIPQNPVSFADGYPFLITNTASLEELNRRLAETYNNLQEIVPMNRFRPNLVIQTDQPFIEDTWKTVQIGSIPFDLVKPCSRCIVTTTDQDTAKRNPLKEPLKTLSTFRLVNGEILFGQNAIARQSGWVKVGDGLFVDG